MLALPMADIDYYLTQNLPMVWEDPIFLASLAAIAALCIIVGATMRSRTRKRNRARNFDGEVPEGPR